MDTYDLIEMFETDVRNYLQENELWDVYPDVYSISLPLLKSIVQDIADVIETKDGLLVNYHV